MMKGPVRELLPIGPLKVRLRMPEGVKSRKVQLLAARTKPRVERSGEHLAITVPSVLDHEVIAIDI